MSRTLALTLVALLPLLTGCFGPLAKRLADKQTYGIIADKQMEALGISNPDFSIEPTTTPLTLAILNEARQRAEDPTTTEPLTVSLSDALALAFDNNRQYRTQKENLYLAALDLTSARHEFSPIFSGSVAARATHQPESTGVENFGEIASNFAVTKVFATGARVTVGYSQSLLRLYASPSTIDTAEGTLSASLVQPLLRDFGPLVTLENLRQSERDMVYAVRDFARFQKDFIIERIDDYYRLLQSFDEVSNQWRSYQRIILVREQAELEAEAERRAPFQVDQARQDEISARNRWINAQTSYEQTQDQFIVNLGLPTEINLQADPGELQALRERGLVDLQWGLSSAVDEALENRLDFLTAQQVIEDSDRRVRIAENSLLPALDARVNASLDSDAGANQPLDFSPGDNRRVTGELALELPLDRLNERNNYRRSLIGLERQRRSADQLRNDILVEVRANFRNVEEARQGYEIQLVSRDLADRRVRSVELLLEAGREATIRDRLEAEDALLNAENSVTRELVNYTIARLRFYNSLERLEIDEQGYWYEDQRTTASAQ